MHEAFYLFLVDMQSILYSCVQYVYDVYYNYNNEFPETLLCEQDRNEF